MFCKIAEWITASLIFFSSSSLHCNNWDLFLCTRVVDGDTIVVDMDGKRKSGLSVLTLRERFILQKPVEYFGKEASAFTKQMVEGKQVRLRFDWQKGRQI